jgi:hypothetical protein
MRSPGEETDREMKDIFRSGLGSEESGRQDAQA